MENETQKVYGDKGHVDGFTRCLTGPSKDVKWKIAFYLPIPKTDEEAKARYACDMGTIMHKGLLGIGHSIDSKSVFDIDGMLNKEGEPTKACIDKVIGLADQLQTGRSGPTKKALEAEAIRKEAEASMLAKLGIGSMEEFEKYASKIKK